MNTLFRRILYAIGTVALVGMLMPDLCHAQACPREAVTSLIAGQTIDIGTVTVRIEDNILFVDYATEGGWVLAASQLAVAATLEEIPVTRSGNPKVGHFPFKETHDPVVTDYTYSVDLEAWDLREADELYFAAHADVQLLSKGGEVLEEEGAWGEGENFPQLKGKGRGNWAMYFTVDVQQLRGLLLWNKLGSAEEVQNSEVGPDGVIVGDIEFLPCKYGNGMKPLPRTGDRNIPDNFIDFEALNLGNQGCIEFWYQPDYIDPSVGHIVEMFWYGIEDDPLNLYFIRTGFNDWQNLFNIGAFDLDWTNGLSGGRAPASIPGWSTTEPFHIALTWDGTEPVVKDRLKFFVDGVQVIDGYNNSGDPMLDDWLPEAVLRLGSRLISGDWNRHNWEGDDAVIDNIKVWSCPKTDFSDRFDE